MHLTITLFATGIVLSAFAPGSDARAQSVAEEAGVATTVVAAQQRYDASFPTHPQLYNGPEYVDYSRLYHERIGHQFFLSPKRLTGSVYYNDHLFNDLQLSYDIVRDQLVLESPSTLTLRLVNEKVGYFFIDGHRFIRLQADSTAPKGLSTGFYEVLNQGRAQVLGKRTKRMQELLRQQNLDVEFTPNDRLYVKKDGVYYPVKSKSAARRAFADRSKEIQAYLQSHRLVFGKEQLEASVVELTSYYNSLPPQ